MVRIRVEKYEKSLQKSEKSKYFKQFPDVETLAAMSLKTFNSL